MENALNWLIEQASKLISGGLVGICKLLAGQTPSLFLAHSLEHFS